VRRRPELLIGIICLVAAQLIASGPLRRMRQEQAPVHEAYEALTPGEFAGTLLLGGFRGLACDLLWIRADEGKDHGRYYESLALYRAISSMQPRFEQVWSYMAWDMAYNIGHEVDDEDAKWTWMMAGLETGTRGCLRNPQSIALLRHLAWMLNHRGDLFHAEIERTAWAPLLQPVVDEVNRQLPPEQRLAPVPTGTGLTNFRLASIVYRACVRLAEARHIPQAHSTPCMVPLAIESDGNQQRNRGRHLDAVRVWLEALEAWQELRDHYAAPVVGDSKDAKEAEMQRDIALDSYARNEGHLRRKAAQLALALAPSPERGAAVADAIMQRRLAEARAALAEPGWSTSARFGRIRWLDEQ
jgi:hypothetical protein